MELNDSRESRGSSNYEEGDSFESEHWRNDSFENDYGPQDDDEEADQVMNMMRNTKVREKEDLMDAFLEVVGGDDDNAAEFFLEANNWNLDGAIAAFFEEMKRGGLASSRELSKNNNSKQNHHNRGDDIEMDGGENNINNNNASAHKVRISTKGGSFIYDEEGDNSLKAELVDEFDLEEGANVRPGEEITKTWRIGNSSVRPWPPQCALVFVDGMRFCDEDCVELPEDFILKPNEYVDISVSMVAPDEPGEYASLWQMTTKHNIPFGEQLWMSFNVVDFDDVLDKFDHAHLEGGSGVDFDGEDDEDDQDDY